MSKKSTENLSSTQKKVKNPRRCIYDGDKKNTDPELARDIISLYVTCKLGYSPIRHIVGLSSDKKIEDVIRQHMLGRKDVDGTIGELSCPNSTEISESCMWLIQEYIQKYNTGEDAYIRKMLSNNKWNDDPITSKSKVCAFCGKPLESDWVSCPYCGHRRDKIPGSVRNLF